MKKLLLLCTVLLVLSCDSDEDKAGRFFIKGNEALNNGELEKAIRFYNESLTIKPNYKEALNNRGVALYQDGRYTEAIIDYSNILVQIDTAYPDAIRNRANAYLADGRYEKALEDLSRLERRFPDSAYVYFTKGIAYHESGDYQQAINAFSITLEKDPKDAEALVNAANSYFMLKQMDKAQSLLTQAEGIDASEPNIYNTRGMIAMETGQLAKAQEWFDQALKMEPGNPYYHNNRGYLLLQMDNLDAAAEDIRRAIIGAPENAWAYRNRGILFLKKERFEDAIRNFETAARFDSKIPLLHFYWAKTLSEQGLLSEACDQLELEIEDSSEITSLRNKFCK